MKYTGKGREMSAVQFSPVEHYQCKVVEFISTWFRQELSSQYVTPAPVRYRGGLAFLTVVQGEFSYDGVDYSVGDEIAVVANTLDLLPAESLYRAVQEQ